MIFPLIRTENEVARDRRAGFTLIELLVVIAIIAILAAVIFPAAATVRIRAQQGQVTANLKSIQAALATYKQDENGYPPTLGPVTFRNDPANYAALYPEWIRSRQSYGSPALDLPETDVLVPVNAESARSRGFISALPDKRVQVAQDPVRRNDALMNAWNTMDGHVWTNGSSDPNDWVYIPHYSRFRTLDPNNEHYKRQLFYRNPPEDTVITWNDTFVQKDDADIPIRGDYLVLFLNGTVRKYSVKQVADQLREHGWPQRQEIWRIRL